MAEAEAAAAAAVAERRRGQVRRAAGRLLAAAGDTEPRRLVPAGEDVGRLALADIDPIALDGVWRLARLAADLPASLSDHPDRQVRRAVAVLAARAHPLLLGLEDPPREP